MTRAVAENGKSENVAISPLINRSAFLRVALTLVVVFVWCVAWYLPTAIEVAAVWWRSETYAHGLIVLPVFAWLVWSKRNSLGGLRPEPIAWLAAPAALAGFMWLLGKLVSVAAAAHAGFILMLVIGMVATLGWRLSRVLLFPLAFLLFGIPIGDFLLPMLMDRTAEFTVWALRLSGVPVYQEGLHFVVPNGRWSVVEACSGIRYLIASVMVGSLYAYINYTSLRKRLLFMLVAILVPIVANWIRAYLIVMLGYLSNNELAAGVDHLIYGWVFFGVVIMLMFWIGQRWSDPPCVAKGGAGQDSPANTGSWLRVMPVAAVIALFPLIGGLLDAPSDSIAVSYALPAPVNGWSEGSASVLTYRPHYRGFRAEKEAAYLDPKGGTVVLYSALFADQREGAEMVAWGNGLVLPGSNHLNLVSKQALNTPLGLVRRAQIIGGGERVSVAHWYVVNGRIVTRDWELKLRLARNRLMGRPDVTMVFVVATPAVDEEEGSRRLSAFMSAYGESLEQIFANVATRVTDGR
ncbi:MAG: exosortase A [Azoarcus sp.]|jgi:exosortase A|nr:exosortase A [Azoarcus sp.]MDX9838820.1 exosortase A [Azoarcus sp.]